MPTIENSVIKVKTAAIITATLLSLVTTGLTVYFTSMKGVEKGFEHFNVLLLEQKNEIEKIKIVLDLQLNQQQRLNDQVDINTLTIKTITDFIKPKSPEIEHKN